MQSLGILDTIFGQETPIVWYFTYNTGGKDICTNAITHLRKIDYICLKKTPEVQEIWLWAKSLFSYSENQVIFYDVPNNKAEETLIIRQILENFRQYHRKPIFFPFKIDPILNQEAKKAGIEVCADDIYQLPDKRWLHPVVPSEIVRNSSIFSKKLPENLNVLPGYTCFSRDQLREARKLLIEKNIRKFIIKNVFTSAGKNIHFIENDSEEEFEKILESIQFENLPNRIFEPAHIIEQMLEFELDSNCLTKTPIVHCIGKHILPFVLHQIVKGAHYLGASSQSPIPEIVEKCLEQTKILSESLDVKGPWGVDFVVDKNSNPYPIDINVGRICGSHYFRLFADLYARGQIYESWKVGHAKASILKIQETLKMAGLEFDFVKKSGVFLIRAGDPGNLTVLVVAEKKENLDIMKETVRMVLKELVEHSF